MHFQQQITFHDQSQKLTIKNGQIIEITSQKEYLQYYAPLSKCLMIEFCKITRTGMKYFVDLMWKRLKEITIWSCCVEENVVQMINELSFPQIVKINIIHGSVKGIEDIRYNPLEKLEELELIGNKIDYNGVKILSQASWKFLKKLFFCNNGFSAQDMDFLVKFTLPQLKSLNITYNKIGDRGLKHLMQGSWQNLDQLLLIGNDVGDQGVLQISKSNLPLLKTLCLQINHITLNGMKSLTKLVGFDAIEILMLGKNNVEYWREEIIARQLKEKNPSSIVSFEFY